jgi:hypothetical protein
MPHDKHIQTGGVIMSVRLCQDCHKEVSTQAKACPHCGRILKTGGRTCEAIGTIMVIGGVFTCFINGTLGAFVTAVGFLVFLVGRFQ